MSSVILIAEDEASIADAIEIYLKSQGYQTLKAANGAIAWELLQNNTVDLAIIDVMMPVMDGIALTMKIRELYEFPIIILSAKSEDIDKITGLNIGADDYVTKPFVPMELLARVHAQLRRHLRYQQLLEQKQEVEDRLLLGGIELHRKSKEVFVDGESRRLTPIEFRILQLFMEHPGQVFSSDDIY